MFVLMLIILRFREGFKNQHLPLTEPKIKNHSDLVGMAVILTDLYFNPAHAHSSFAEMGANDGAEVANGKFNIWI